MLAQHEPRLICKHVLRKLGALQTCIDTTLQRAKGQYKRYFEKSNHFTPTLLRHKHEFSIAWRNRARQLLFSPTHCVQSYYQTCLESSGPYWQRWILSVMSRRAFRAQCPSLVLLGYQKRLTQEIIPTGQTYPKCLDLYSLDYNAIGH